MWHGFISKTGTQNYAKGKAPVGTTCFVEAKTRKELFKILDKLQRQSAK